MNSQEIKLSVKLKSVNENHAVLSSSDGHQIKWPKDQLPANLKEGDNFYLIATKDQDARLDPKKILEEILNGEEEKEAK